MGPHDFQVNFGLLTLKAYTSSEHVLRFEAVVHNSRQLGVGRVLERFPEIVGRLHGMVDRFLTTHGCVNIGFIPDGTLDTLAVASQVGATPARWSLRPPSRPKLRRRPTSP